MVASPVAGPHLRALLQLTKTWDRRKKPDGGLLATAAETTSPELRAFLEAVAERKSDIYGLSIDEYLLVSSDVGDTVPTPAYAEFDGFDEGKIVIGHSPGGDLFVVEVAPKGKKAPVWRMAHDEEWTPYLEAANLESFLKKNFDAVRDDDPTDEAIVALDLAKRDKKPAPLKPAAAPTTKPAAPKATAASKKKAAAGGAKLAWRAASRPKDEGAESKGMRLLRKRYPEAIVLDALPNPVVIRTDKRGARVAVSKGGNLVPLKVPVVQELRWDLSPSRTSLVFGSPLLLFHVDLATGKVTETPSVGWYDAVSFVDDSVFVLNAHEDWRQPEPTAEVNALLAKYKRRGKELWLFNEGALHVMAVEPGQAPRCVQRIEGGTTHLKGFLGRHLVVRKPRDHGDSEDPLDALTWIFTLKNQRLVFVASLSKDPGVLFETRGRVFGDNGYELVNLEAAADRAGDAPASRLPFETTTTEEPAALPPPTIEARPARGKKKPKLEAAALPAAVAKSMEWISPPSATGTMLARRAKSEGELVLIDKSKKVRPITPALQAKDVRYAFHADGKRCLVTFGNEDYDSEHWEVETATGKAVKLAVEDAFFIPEACGWLGELFAFAPSTTPIGSCVDVGPRKGKKVVTDTLDARASRLFPISGGRLVTGVPTDATYMGFTSCVLAIVKGKPAIVGRLEHGATDAWDEDGKTFIEATDGKTYELSI